MTSQLPFWLQVLSASLTPAVAVTVGIVAYLQWRTAHQKVVLDLFDRRLRTFYAAIDAVNRIIEANKLLESDLRKDFLLAARDSLFLFGDEVNDYVEDTRVALRDVAVAENGLATGDGDADKWARERKDKMSKVTEFLLVYPKLCEPYLKLDQKRVRTPLRWLLDVAGFEREPKWLRQADRERAKALTL